MNNAKHRDVEVCSGASAMIELALEPRLCECCGGGGLEPIWSNRSLVKKATATYLFRVHVVVCRTCGFCFTSPCHTAEALRRYYADGLSSYKGISLPYAIEPRLSVLERYRAPLGVFAEIGGDQPMEFHRRCIPLFGTVLNVDVSEDAPSDYRCIEDLPDASVDVIAHYDVLEHVPDVRGFLIHCWRALKDRGIMVCEVPDVRLYPRNLLLSEFSHLNHFSATTLAAIARQCGLTLVEIGHLCSRPFGFLSVFRKDRVLTECHAGNPFEYMDTLACVRGGLEQIQRVTGRIQSLRTRIGELGARGEKVTLWGVTDLLRRLIDQFRLPPTAIVVDIDPRRSTHLESDGIVVHQPKDSLEHIQESALLVICAPRYRTDILEWVLRKTGRSLGGDELEVIGSGASGESLL